MTTLEHVGNLYIENQRLLEEAQRWAVEYKSLLSLVQRMVSGGVLPRDVSVDMDKQTWGIVLDIGVKEDEPHGDVA